MPLIDIPQDAWGEYNEDRPKKSLGGLPPAIYAETLKQKDVELTAGSKAKCY